MKLGSSSLSLLQWGWFDELCVGMEDFLPIRQARYVRDFVFRFGRVSKPILILVVNTGEHAKETISRLPLQQCGCTLT
jgi:hypothetical protein